MNHLKTSILTAALALVSLTSANAQSLLRITEAMSSSSSGTGGTPDWFEITNFGNSAQSLSGWKMDDGSFASGSSVPLVGVTSIAPGESVIFIEDSGGNVENFKNFWGGLTGIKVGYYSGAGVGLSSNGDGVVIFDSTNEINRVSFGAATTGVSFNFGYDASGVLSTPPDALSATGMFGVTTVTRTYGTGTTAFSNTGSPGVVPEPSSATLILLGLSGLLALRRISRTS
jgi:hypothetical protein